MVASEVHPFATSGGLAEVASSLPLALERLGHKTTIVMPWYRRVAASHADVPPDGEATIDFGGRARVVGYRRTPVSSGVDVVFVDVPELFDRDGLYGTSAGDFQDNGIRFAVFARAALEYVRTRGRRPSVLHLHDWQAGLVPAYQKMLFSSDPVVGGVPAVFTIHNLAFQGIYPASMLPDIGLPWEVMHVQAMEYWGRISYLKAGINFSERITTVSPSYAREVLSPELGFGLDGVLRRRADDFTGILNGINADRWDPSRDGFLPAPYSADDPAGKRECKRALLQTAGLPHDDANLEPPLVGLVSRMTDQKGFDLLASAARQLMALDANWVLLGSGEGRYEELWTALAAGHPKKVSATIGYDERLEHLIEGGADLFLMPSRFEPCGLNQLNSLRYGALPVVRATGGLNDTVVDANDDPEKGTGFKFEAYTPEALLEALDRAMKLYRNPAMWRKIQENAMRQDYSWDVSAREYVKVYKATS